MRPDLKSTAINCKNSETPHKQKHKPDKGNQSIQCPIDDVGIGGRCGGAPRVISATFHVSWAKAEGASAAASGTRHEWTKPALVYLQTSVTRVKGLWEFEGSVCRWTRELFRLRRVAQRTFAPWLGLATGSILRISSALLIQLAAAKGQNEREHQWRLEGSTS